jgi:hypothetical protein
MPEGIVGWGESEIESFGTGVFEAIAMGIVSMVERCWTG